MAGASTIDKIALRMFRSLNFQRPSDVLRETLPDVLAIVGGVPVGALSKTRKAIRETYHAALIGLALEKTCENLGHPGKVWLAMSEDEAYDCILKGEIPNEELNEKFAVVKVQLKTLPDALTAPDASLEGILSEAKEKYRACHDLALGIHIQRDITVDYSRLDLRNLEIQQLWISGHPQDGLTTISGGLLQDLRSGWLQTVRVFDFQTVRVSCRRFTPR